MTKEYMTPKELADYLGVSERTIARLVKEKRIPQPYRLTPRVVRFSRSEIDEHLKEMKNEDEGTDNPIQEESELP